MTTMKDIEELLDTINSGDVYDQVEAVFELAKLGNYQYIDLLLQALENDDWEVRADAAHYLGRIGWLPALEKLGELITDDAMDDNKNVAIYAAQAIGLPSAVPLIINGLRDENPDIRIDSRTALYRLLGDVILPLLDPEEEELMEDSEKREEIYLKNAEQIQAWWQSNKSVYDPDKVYFMGEEVTPNLLFKEFKKEPRVNGAYLELLQDYTGLDFGEYSKKMLELWESWLRDHAAIFQKGKRYFWGKAVQYK
jgi:hypothetical protein